jgi:hypothetical protein
MVLTYTNALVKLPDMAEVPFVGALGGVVSHRPEGDYYEEVRMCTTIDRSFIAGIRWMWFGDHTSQAIF